MLEILGFHHHYAIFQTFLELSIGNVFLGHRAVQQAHLLKVCCALRQISCNVRKLTL